MNITIEVNLEHLVEKIVKDYVLGEDAGYCIYQSGQEYWHFTEQQEEIEKATEEELFRIAEKNKNKLMEMIEEETKKQIKELIEYMKDCPF